MFCLAVFKKVKSVNFLPTRIICFCKFFEALNLNQRLYYFSSSPCLNSVIVMPPKRKNTAKADDAEEAIRASPKKRGRKADQHVENNKEKPKEDAKEAIRESPKKRGRKADQQVENNKEKPKEDANEAISGSPKKQGRKADQQVEDIKEKPKVKNQKKDASSDKQNTKETKKEKKTTSKKEPSKNIEKESTTTKKSNPKPALLNTAETKWKDLDFGCKRKNVKGQDFNLKITSWNVDGLRAWLKKDGLSIIRYDNPDIICFQETKCSEDKIPDEAKGIEGYHDYWCSSNKEGYAGVAVYSKKEPLNVEAGIGLEEHDKEGRCLTLEYPKFFLVNVYVPNAGRGLVTLDKRLDWNEAFKKYIKELDRQKPVILCGDMNVAHNEIDLANPKSNKKNAGFTQEERDGMTDFLSDGYVDSFRELYPEETQVYTFWSYMSKARSKNIGWRLDYFILSKRIMEKVCDIIVRNEVYGSDHCPTTLFINI